MKDKAIAKITEEAMKIDNPVAFAIEEYLTSKIRTNAEASLILSEDKTLKGAYDKVWAEARKRKKRKLRIHPAGRGLSDYRRILRPQQLAQG